VLKTFLYMFSISVLVCAGLVFVLCANQWLQYAHNNVQKIEPSIVEKFQSIGNIHKESNQEQVSPLVSQSSEFALIIDPPKLPEVVKEVEQPEPEVTPPVFRAPKPSARFKLLSTSYNRDRPEDSVALIDEPGKGEHWAKAGDFIGNFVLERIESGSIVYRYGNQVSEMAVEMRPPVRIDYSV
jgi:hypothetical protein